MTVKLETQLWPKLPSPHDEIVVQGACYAVAAEWLYPTGDQAGVIMGTVGPIAGGPIAMNLSTWAFY